MYGILNTALRSFIIERHGESTWKIIMKHEHIKDTFGQEERYDDTITQAIIDSALRQLNFQREPFLEMFGGFLVQYIRRYGYDELMRNLSNNVLEFLQNLDFVQSYLKEEYQDIIMPSFHCDEDSVADRMVLHYFSQRPGYQHIVIGFIREAAKSLYKMELQIDVISNQRETVSSDGRSLEREHVVFNIMAKQVLENMDDAPPTFIAQTKRHGERQILQDDVESVKKKLEEIRVELGEDALPLAKYRKGRAKWKAVAKISLLNRGGFVPNYPEQIAVNPRMFIEVFPYHVIFDANMRVHQSGLRIQQLMPSIRNRHSEVKDYFTLRYPRCLDLSYENIRKFIMSPFILELRRERMQKAWSKRPPLLIKGQMFYLRDKGFMFFVASPYIRTWEDLESRAMKLSDLPMWDATRDFLLSDVAFRVGTGQYYGHYFLDTNVNIVVNAADMMNRIGDDEKDSGNEKDNTCVRNKWYRIQKDLENEREKNDILYHAFMPRPIANMIRKGEIPAGEFYPEVTALFCDVVHFIQMVAGCKPSDVLAVLNSLYVRFDRLTKVHDTFRVEAIGDAYFVVSGTPESLNNHAERIANTALGMVILSQEIASPLYGEKIMLRIGVHTGSLVCGVVGSRLPRFIVMGETAVVASKMESHGEPGKIHISPSTFRAIQDKGFSTKSRGKININGFGTMDTYYLLGNDNATEDEIVGRSQLGQQEISYINEGNEEIPNFERKRRSLRFDQSSSYGDGSRPQSGESEIVPFIYK